MRWVVLPLTVLSCIALGAGCALVVREALGHTGRAETETELLQHAATLQTHLH